MFKPQGGDRMVYGWEDVAFELLQLACRDVQVFAYTLSALWGRLGVS